MNEQNNSSFFPRLSAEINNYFTSSVEISEGVKFSQYQLIKRLMKFKNRDLAGTKITEDLRYLYYFDIIAPRHDSEVKNLRFDTKNILTFSRNPIKDFAAVWICNAMLKEWMMEHGEDDKLKSVVEKFSYDGNVGFKKVKGGYEIVDIQNTYILNQRAETVKDTDIVERHEMTASQLVRMTTWNQGEIKTVIKDNGNLKFSATEKTTPDSTTSKRYEVYEFTGEVSEKEYNELAKINKKGDENVYFLAKIIVSGINQANTGSKNILFVEKLSEDMEDYYIYAHRGKYTGRFWRAGIAEILFDHQIRANEIGNDIAKGLEWASKVVFKSKDNQILQNIRADIDNGDVVITDDLQQLDVRLHNLDQLIADWNRLIADADRVSNSTEAIRGEAPPSGTPFGTTTLLNDNANKMFVTLRQKIALPFRRVFREWVLPELYNDLKGQDIIRLTGDEDILEQFREIAVNAWYVKNLVKIGPHTKEDAAAIKAEKLKEFQNIDPTIQNEKESWEGVKPRLFITITGENSDAADNVQDMVNLLGLEQDPGRITWMLDMIYRLRNIPIPPKEVQQPQGIAQPGVNPQAGNVNPRAQQPQRPQKTPAQPGYSQAPGK